MKKKCENLTLFDWFMGSDKEGTAVDIGYAVDVRRAS